MTQQLQQSLKLLQLSTVELSAYIEQELANNPLLERDNGEQLDASAETMPEPTSMTQQAVDSDSHDGAEMTESMWDDRVQDASEPNVQEQARLASEVHVPTSGGTSFNSNDDRQAFLENSMSNTVSLQEHLLDQVVVEFDGAEQQIAIHLIDLLDASGYFTADVTQVAENLGCEAQAVEACLARLKTCDPAGVFAADLAECLALQLKDKDRFDPAMAVLIDNLNLLADGDIKKLSQLCGVDQDDVVEMCAEIRMLDPKPGNEYSVDAAQVVEPDMFVFQDQAGLWQVELNPNTLPKLIVNNRYYTEVKAMLGEKDDKNFMTEQYQHASWLVKALHQRAQTMLKVASAIIYQQNAFFNQGVYHLRPMVFQDVADMIDMHESTVGRVVNNKYMMTPRGMFELRYFFTSGIKTAGEGGDISSRAVNQLIKELIDAETAQAVLSDDAISTMLKARGMDIARRTVAKYRESMHIPSSAQRKRQKRLLA